MQYLAHVGVDDYGWGWGMMPGMMSGTWFWLGGLTQIVWLTVGILLIAWLWKQINK